MTGHALIGTALLGPVTKKESRRTRVIGRAKERRTRGNLMNLCMFSDELGRTR